MASYRTRDDAPRRQDDQTIPETRSTHSRLPQRSMTPTTTTSLNPLYSQARLRKKQKSEQAIQSHILQGRAEQKIPPRKSSMVALPQKGSAEASPSFRRLLLTQPGTIPAVPGSSRLPRPEALQSLQTPSLVFGFSGSATNGTRLKTLRRKQSSVGAGLTTQHDGAQSGSNDSWQARSQMENPSSVQKYSHTVLNSSRDLPSSSSCLSHSAAFAELSGPGPDHFDISSSMILPTPNPQYALSVTPSTRHSDSPSPFSVSSTPTSMSSYSPGTSLSNKSPHRILGTSPAPPRSLVTRTKASQEKGLASVRESSTSSSSASTIKATSVRHNVNSDSKQLPSLPANPPASKMSTIRAQTIVSAASSRNTRGQSSTSRRHIPPELAHLSDQSAISSQSRTSSRRSQDGIMVSSHADHIPQVGRGTNEKAVPHKRSTSKGSLFNNVATTGARFALRSKRSGKVSMVNDADSDTSNSLLPSNQPSRDVSDHGNKPRSRTLPAPTLEPTSHKTSRFGFLGKRSKTEPGQPFASSERKAPRKGPAAGTGHEGYGRHALRDRSGSTASGTSIGRSPSAATTTESLDRTPSSRKSSMTSSTSADLDDFFLDRLAPKFLRGAGNSAELSRSPEPISDSVGSIPAHPPTMDTAGTDNSQFTVADMAPSLLPSAMSDPVRRVSPVKKFTRSFRRPSESDDDAPKASQLSIATKRSSHGNDNPIISKRLAMPDRGKRTIVRDLALDSGEAGWLKSSERALKRVNAEGAVPKPSRKWNFFQRAQAGPRVVASSTKPSWPTTSPARAGPSRSVAHYALSSPQSRVNLGDIEQLMQEADSTAEDSSVSVEGAEMRSAFDVRKAPERLHSMLLPPKPVLSFASPTRPPSPKVTLNISSSTELPPPKLSLDTDTHEGVGKELAADRQSPADLTPVTDLSPCSSPFRPLSPERDVAASVDVAQLPSSLEASIFTQTPSLPGPPPSGPPPRPSRLAQVGRIPQVISRRAQVHRPPSVSFSRPFAANQPRPDMGCRTSTGSFTSLMATAGPLETVSVLDGHNTPSYTTSIGPHDKNEENIFQANEFCNLPQRKDSEVSYSSSSGIWSFPPATGTAIVPDFGSPQSEDEVWNEYNDLIDEVLSPIELDSRELKSAEQRSPAPLPQRPNKSKTDAHTDGPWSGAAHPSLHLRRSRLLAVLHAHSPTSPASCSEFLHAGPDRAISVIDTVTGRLSHPSMTRMSTGSIPRTRPSSTRSSLPPTLKASARHSQATFTSGSDRNRRSGNVNRYRDTKLLEIAEAQADGLVSMANLRFGALMTSKWLSFGRVLFSPAHLEMKNPSEDRVLVIDGLGKDWSYYCAVTYPEATVYNFGPRSTSSSLPKDNAPEPWSTLKNHRHINQPSMDTAFPFPKGFFACVVLRFPGALPSAVHRFVISESKRVLRPGGYLELSLLDLDLVNMGNRARRAVRGLKVQMQAVDSTVSLRNSSDEMMALLGRKGFIECNRCFVGVPVAGRLPQPDRTASQSKAHQLGHTVDVSDSSESDPLGGKDTEVAFSDLLNTQITSESTDKSITEMVARVGRWWYSRCYESMLLPDGAALTTAQAGRLLDNSIWRDDALVNECMKRGTSFRLLIGYAQKPECGFRRTVSV